MSQATQGAPAPQPAAPPTAAVVGTPAPTPAAPGTGRATAYESLGTSREDDVARRQAAQVPTTLTRLRLGAIVVCLLFGAVTGLQLALSWQANRTAAADTEQLIRVQGIKTNLLRADALATNAFLIGGLEPAEQRAAYDGAIDQTVRAITDAAEAQPADRAALSELSSAVLDYVGDMELARANNRQGLPVGGAYLRKASSELRSTALPIVDQLVDSNSTRHDGRDGRPPSLVGVPAGGGRRGAAVVRQPLDREAVPPSGEPRDPRRASSPSVSSGSSRRSSSTASRTRTTSSPTARSSPWWTGPRPARPPTTPRRTRACG